MRFDKLLSIPALVLAGSLTLSACGGEEAEVEDVGVGEGVGAEVAPAAPVAAPAATTFDPALDVDRDGILDPEEGVGDADGDGILDRDEAYPATP